jgi:mitotic spindle assembly checkpoint protein MAD2
MSKARSGAITLKGSSQIVAEYFGFAMNSILYLRGVYDPDSFTAVKKYNLRLFVTTDDRLSDYIKQILKQLTGWLADGTVKKLVLVLQSIDTQETIERWVFNVETNPDALDTSPDNQALLGEKDLKTIQNEIAHVMRQITSSSSFLPIIDIPCSFDTLIYTVNDDTIPTDWELSDPKFIFKSNEVRFRSFDTFFHKVDTSVTYKVDE